MFNGVVSVAVYEADDIDRWRWDLTCSSLCFCSLFLVRLAWVATYEPSEKHLVDFRAIASRIIFYLTKLVVYRGGWEQATRRRLLHGVKADGVGR